MHAAPRAVQSLAHKRSHAVMNVQPPAGPAEMWPPAVCVCLTVLTQRADFLRAAQGLRYGTAAVHLQARPRTASDAAGIRVGYTCSKKVGNAVARNRAKRRLRAAAAQVLPQLGRDGWDYVLVGRKDVTADLPFADLLADLTRALRKVHQ